MYKSAGVLSAHSHFLVASLLLFFLVNPLRESPSWTDDFAYARMVQHLLQTGDYHLDNWSATNPFIQIYYASFLCRLFRYSFITLRLSTLLILAFGVLAFYNLLKDLNIGFKETQTLTMVLLSSPLVIFLGFSFMTDIPFVSFLIIAMLFYGRGFLRESLRSIAAGSVAAACAIGTRHFGAALIIGLIGTWLTDKNRSQRKWLYFTGLLLPTLTAFGQFLQTTYQPSFTQRVRLAEQKIYFYQGLWPLLAESAWRISIVLQYAGLFLLPLFPFLLLAMRKLWNRNGLRSLLLFSGWLLFVGATVLYGFKTAGSAHGQLVRSGLTPSIPWVLASFITGPARIPLTLFSCACAVILGWLFSIQFLRGSYWRNVSQKELLIHLTVLALGAFHILYTQLNDTYVICFLPGIILVLAPILPQWPRVLRRSVLVLSLCMLTLSSFWTRGVLAREEAFWQAAEKLREEGARAQDIGGNVAWSTYYGEFDAWLANSANGHLAQDLVGPYELHGPYYQFLVEHDKRSPYLVSETSLQACKSTPTKRWASYHNYMMRSMCVQSSHR